MFLQIRWNPAVEPMRPDSGLFAYAGVEMAKGADLYRDIWDNKPPGIFTINFLAVSIGGSSPWSLWAASALAVVLAAAAVCLAVYLATSLAAAAVSTAVFLLVLHHPSYYQGGNLTELYALVPNAAILLAFAFYLRRSYRGFPALVGALTALAFLIKPNMVSVGAATLLLAALRLGRTRHWREVARTFGAAALAFAIVLAPVIIYFSQKGTLAALIEAVFSSTLAYSGEGLSIRSLYGTARKLSIEQPLGALVGLALLTAVLLAFLLRKGGEGYVGSQSRNGDNGWSTWFWLTAAALLAFPFQALSAAATGRNFGHYFLDPILTLSINVGLLLFALRRLEGERWYWPAVSIALFLCGTVLLSTFSAVLPSFETLASTPHALSVGDYVKPAVHDYILDRTAPGDEVLVWSNHPSINFLTGRRSPTAYLHVYHVLDSGSGGLQRFQDFTQDLRLRMPRLIVAQPQSSAGIPYFAAEGEALCPDCEPEVRKRMENLREFVAANYIPVAEVADWVVLEFKR